MSGISPGHAKSDPTKCVVCGKPPKTGEWVECAHIECPHRFSPTACPPMGLEYYEGHGRVKSVDEEDER